MKFLTVTQIEGPPMLGCFDQATPDTCYYFSATGNEDAHASGNTPAGEWSTYFTHIEVPAALPVPAVAIPEPSTALLLAIGLVVLAEFGRRNSLVAQRASA